MPRLVRSIDDLKRKSEVNIFHCFVLLSGVIRSSKSVSYDRLTDMWCVYNEISDTETNVSTSELDRETNLVEAIGFGELWYD